MFKDGVVHFANTDRVYSPSAFEEMRKVQHVGIWPTQRARERFTCNPKLTLQSSYYVKYRLNIGSVGLSVDAVLDSDYKFKISESDTQGVGGLIAKLVDDVEDLEVISCDGRFVWYIRFQR